MKDEKPSYETLEARLARAEEMIAVMRDGQVDAILGEDSIYMVRLKDAEEASKRNWALFQNTFENAAIGIAHMSTDGHFVRVNQKLCDIVGYDKDELHAMTFQDITHPEDLDKDLVLVEQLVRGEIDHYTLEKRYIRKDGDIVWIRLTGSMQSKKLCIGIIEDISQRKEAERGLHKAHEELEHRVQERTAELAAESERRRYLAKRLVNVLEEDRRSLSMMLHDDIGQIIVGTKMQIENLENDLTEIDSHLPAKIGPILASLQGILSSLRSRSRELRPNSLDTLGLAAALRSIGTGDSKYRIRYHIPEEPEGVHPDLKLTIFRIAQEAVINALKHAGCDEIFLSLTNRDHTLTLMVEDNGKGFSWDAIVSSETAQGPLGMLIMRERAVNAGGKFRVESAPGKGTTVIAEFPQEVDPASGEDTSRILMES